MITREDIAAMLDCRQYGSELKKDEARKANESGLVVVFGQSDDTVRFMGAFDDEASAYNATLIPIDKSGLLENKCYDQNCPYFAEKKASAKSIKAEYGKDGVWKFETDIPHSTFKIFEGAELYSVGIVFSVSDL